MSCLWLGAIEHLGLIVRSGCIGRRMRADETEGRCIHSERSIVGTRNPDQPVACRVERRAHRRDRGGGGRSKRSPLPLVRLLAHRPHAISEATRNGERRGVGSRKARGSMASSVSRPAPAGRISSLRPPGCGRELSGARGPSQRLLGHPPPPSSAASGEGPPIATKPRIVSSPMRLVERFSEACRGPS